MRKSFHKAGDRISGNMQFYAAENKVKCGDLFIVNHNPLLAFGKNPVFSLVKYGEKFLIDCQFYDDKGNLILWMSKNRYWVIDSFSIKVDKTFLEISSVDFPNNNLKIKQIDDYF